MKTTRALKSKIGHAQIAKSLYFAQHFKISQILAFFPSVTTIYFRMEKDDSCENR